MEEMKMMAKKADSIYISKDFDRWVWFNDSKVFQVFIWLLFEANLEDGMYCNEIIHRGEVATKNEIIATHCNLTIDNVRKALAKLEMSGDIKRHRRSFYQLIEIPEYEHYINPFQ